MRVTLLIILGLIVFGAGIATGERISASRSDTQVEIPRLKLDSDGLRNNPFEANPNDYPTTGGKTMKPEW
jgi:hypothetical protein